MGLVVTVAALSDGLDKAQDEVLEPLTGVGTDLSVTRPLNPQQPGDLSASERRSLQREGGPVRQGLADLGEPGEKFSETNFTSGPQLSFAGGRAARVAAMDGVSEAAGGLTLNLVTVSGTVPERDQVQQFGPGSGAPPGPPENIDFDASSVSGVDQAHSGLGAVTAGQMTKGEYFSPGDAREAILGSGYAARKDLAVGDDLKLGSSRFEVVGIATAPLGGQASDIYVKLDQLQAVAKREGRLNTLYVRADSAGDVAAMAKRIEAGFPGAQATTSADLAERVTGSLSDAKDLAGKLGGALTIVGLLAAFVIAGLLTLSSVTKRTRELGTLKAIGWPQRLVVRQVTGEALAQGAVGGALGALIGIGGAAVVSAVGPELRATVAQAAETGPRIVGPGGGPPGGAGGFGQGAVQAGSEVVKLTASVDAELIAIAIGLALAGGLFAGALGSLRAARLRPADALRHID
ncbi:MAG: ABC transporter permease [Thermoleophilaceae bacterium]|nr:ABC transporter permease [Thermoleophilaceae bacterium]